MISKVRQREGSGLRAAAAPARRGRVPRPSSPSGRGSPGVSSRAIVQRGVESPHAQAVSHVPCWPWCSARRRPDAGSTLRSRPRRRGESRCSARRSPTAPATTSDTRATPAGCGTLLAPRGWEVLNQSRGGDNTKTMAPRFAPDGAPDPKVRYLLTVNPGYALLGLSLGNEGIQNGTTKAEKDAIYTQFEAGHARLRRAQPRASHRPGHHAVLHAQRLHSGRVRVHAPHEPGDQRVGRAERQLPRRGGRRHREVGEGVLARLAAPECRRARRAAPDVRADAVRRARAGQADAGPIHGRAASRASKGPDAVDHLHAGRVDASVRVRHHRAGAAGGRRSRR